MISPVYSSFLARLWIVSHLPNFPSLLNLIWTDATLALSLSRVNLALIRTDVTWFYASRWCRSEAPLWDLILQMLHFSWSYDDLVLALLGYLRTSPPKSYLGVFYCLFFWLCVYLTWDLLHLAVWCLSSYWTLFPHRKWLLNHLALISFIELPLLTWSALFTYLFIYFGQLDFMWRLASYVWDFVNELVLCFAGFVSYDFLASGMASVLAYSCIWHDLMKDLIYYYCSFLLVDYFLYFWFLVLYIWSLTVLVVGFIGFYCKLSDYGFLDQFQWS